MIIFSTAARLAFFAVIFAVAARGQAQTTGADAAACTTAGQPSALVRITGFKNGQGIIRVQAYDAAPDAFLKKGKWVRRVEVPLAGRRSLEVCLRLPTAGRYGIAVRHDANASGGSDWNDGGGFSRNPKVSLMRLKPRFDQVAIPVPQGVTRVDIVMNYRHGLSIGPER